jgi:pyruvate,orthophosphate dikinase
MCALTATRWVYDFADGSREMRELLGGKGANIAEMTRVLGPELVPAGFTITTEACVAYMHGADGGPEGLDDAIDEALERLEDRPASGSATPRTRSSSPSAAARATRCPA